MRAYTLIASLNITQADSLSRYLREIQRFPMLSFEEEMELGRRWRDRHDVGAAHKLVTSHLRLVAKIAMGYRRYGLPISELIGEGNGGMMKAVERFDPDRGFRLATYAVWWIRAAIQEYVLRSWSLVKMGTTAAQKKLFFNLRRVKSDLRVIADDDLATDQVSKIATALNVAEQDVIEMNQRLSSRDHSLNAPVTSDDESEWQDWLADETANQETEVAEREELDGRKALLPKALSVLNDRELRILSERRLRDRPATLEELASYFGVSRERVRQIEHRAFEKVRTEMRVQVKLHRAA
jgi:RNA polymerase sigma-32 factor